MAEQPADAPSPPADAAPPPPEQGTGPFAYGPPPEPAREGVPRAFYPLDLDRILHLAGSLLRFCWRPMLGAALVPYLVAYAVMVPLSAAVSPGLNDWLARSQAQVVIGGMPPPFPPELRPWVIALIGAALLIWICGAIASAAVIHIAHATFRGQPTSVGQALRFGLRRAPALVGAQLLLLLAVYGVLLLGVVLGGVLMVGGGLFAFLGLIVIVGAFAALLFLTVRWTLVQQAIVLEGLGPVDALSRSWRLVAGSGWRVLGYVLMLGLLGLVVGTIASAIPSAALGLSPTVSADVALATVFDGLAAVLFTPITTLIMILLYYDLRFRSREQAPLPGEARELAPPSP